MRETMMDRGIRQVGLLLLGLAAAATLVADEPKQIDLGNAGKSSLDWVMSKVDSSRDDWRMEQLTGRADGRLETIRRFLEDPGRLASELDDLFGDKFLGTSMVPASFETVTISPEATLFKGRVEAKASTSGASGWIGSLEALRRMGGRDVHAKFKVFRIMPSGRRSIRTSVLLEMSGGAPSGGFEQIRSEWSVDWQGRDGDDWKLVRAELVTFERAHLARRRFAT